MTKHITMACDRDEHATLKDYSQRKGITLNDLLHCAVDLFLMASDAEQDAALTAHRRENNARS